MPGGIVPLSAWWNSHVSRSGYERLAEIAPSPHMSAGAHISLHINTMLMPLGYVLPNAEVLIRRPVFMNHDVGLTSE